MASGRQDRFTFEPGRDAAPVWSSNGQYIAWQGANAMYMKSADGKGGEQRLHPEPWIPDDWLPDGNGLLFHPPAPREIFLMDPRRSQSSRKVIEGRGITTHARMSPDGKWVAYSNADSGRPEIIIQDSPAASGRWQVSTTGGVQPKWRADGKALFYLTTDGRLLEVPVTLGARVEIGKPQVLFQAQTEFMSGFIWHQVPRFGRRAALPRQHHHRGCVVAGDRRLRLACAHSQPPLTERWPPVPAPAVIRSADADAPAEAAAL